MKKVIPLDLHQTVTLVGTSPGDLPCIIKPYYAGHVIGAAMFHVSIGNQSVYSHLSLISLFHTLSSTESIRATII